ncbi:hypothetical protein AGMMS50284_7850 [Clostridia bacterium]|nr:hypothetical protein AGMMS50284_7850 [Clostridia bacterium]
MTAILKKELNSYFTTGIAYVVLAVFTLFAGIFFVFGCLSVNLANITAVFTNMFMIILLLIPVLTMKLFSEEKKQKTEQGLLTAPVTLTEIVLGKFLSAVIVYAAALIIFVIYAVVIVFFTTPAWSMVFSNLLGIFLLGIAMISISIFLSSIT